ncbi:non-ribosomal peptide synthase [Pochonia chlamydosporia 170]|uniref:Non-ribosomal peptide synthase n=1 Tax=Pochonia chlamydosporia 170 TaxID=1380566 RepID=A0A179G0K9_METCM|nr:non-ribosomal peptide synthase [Pochonia chlamydosporia 170]OAQ70853.2 non-ribosomal peptide synthase [Pochonia chlamydosporia 170]
MDMQGRRGSPIDEAMLVQPLLTTSQLRLRNSSAGVPASPQAAAPVSPVSPAKVGIANVPELLRRQSEVSDLFEDLSTAHRELEGYLNRPSVELNLVDKARAKARARVKAHEEAQAQAQAQAQLHTASHHQRLVLDHHYAFDKADCDYNLDAASQYDDAAYSSSSTPISPVSPISVSDVSALDSSSSSQSPSHSHSPHSQVSSYDDEDMFAAIDLDTATALMETQLLPTRTMSHASSSSPSPSPAPSSSASPSSVPSASSNANNAAATGSRLQPNNNKNGGVQQQQQLENLLLSTLRVAKVCLVRPRAGPFEGQFVALITTTSVHTPNNELITLVPENEREVAQKQIHTLKTAVAEWGSDTRRPDVWVLLQSMAMNAHGEPDARKLQTWVQNIGEEVEEKIMAMQIMKHRRSEGRQQQTREFSTSKQQHRNSSYHRHHRHHHDQRLDPLRPDSCVRSGLEIGYNYNDAVQMEEQRPETLVQNQGEEEYFPLAVMQQLFFRSSVNRGAGESVATGPDYRFSQSILLKVKGDVPLTNQGWAQVIAPESNRAYRFEHIFVNSDDDLLAVIDQAQQSLNIFKGPVFAVKHIRTTKNKQLLYLAAHHLVVDLISWKILMHDLDELLREGTLVSEPSMPFTYWTDYQSYENSQRLIEPNPPFDIAAADLGYWGLEGHSNLYGDTTHLTFALPRDVASTLRKTCNNIFRTESADVFLAALLHSFQSTFSDRPIPTVWKQEHGRDARNSDFNVAETVGWFTALCPINVPVQPGSDLIHLIKLLKDARKAVPQSATPFFQSKFTADDTAGTSLPVEIMFNCVETLNQLQRENGILEPVAAPDREVRSLSSDVGPAVGRIALFEVSVGVDDYGARVEFSFNVNSRHQDRITQWMHNFELSILDAISCLSAMKPELTLSDVPLLETSYEGLTKLMSKRLVDVGITGVDNIETICPVDPIQQEILIAQSCDPNCFHLSRTYELATVDGSEVCRDTLCAAWQTLTATHSVLRSIFIDSVSEKGLFDRVVLKKVSPDMLFMDSSDPMETLSSLPPMKSSKSLPRHRLSVSRSRNTAYLRVDCSQALCDLTAIHNLIVQLRELYMGRRLTIAEPLPPRHNRHIASLDAPRSVEVWRSHLNGATPCTFPNLAIQKQGRLETRGIGLDISRPQLSQFCAESQLDLSTVIQLAWAFVLRTYVGEDRVIFGYSHAGRDEILMPNMKRYVGSLATFVPCLVDFSPMSSILDILWQLERMVKDSRTTDVPTLAEIEHSLGIQGQSLFNTCVTCQDVDDTILSDSDSDSGVWEPVLLANTIDGNCDVSLCVTLRDDRIQADVSYTCLSSNQLHNVMNTFQRALQIIISTPAQLCSQVDLFTEHDHQQIMHPDWEEEQTDTKISTCLHQLILRQCRARPNFPAIYAWDGELSYQQVQASVTALATYLTNIGVGPGVLVPIVLEKSRWSPIIMLAVMQAGGCFVCLDAQDMLMVEAMINQLEPQLVVVTEGAYKHVSQFIRYCVKVNETFLTSLPPQVSVFPQEPLPQQAACAFLAPGAERPKGCFFTHESLCSILSVQGQALKIHNASRVLQISAYTVDVALVEILGTLLHGGCVCIPSALERVNDLEGTIARMDITWTYMTAGLSRKINPANVTNLQTICFRTRTLDEDTFKPWLGTRDVLLAYGAPDVCPLAISVFNISESSDTNIIAPPLLGRFLILNPEDPKKFLPIGAVGELAIDSPIVTPHRYVHGRPLMDPAAFQQFPSERKWRYMRTGHRVRYLDRGHIRFLASMRDEVLVNGSPALIAVLERQIRQCLGGDVDVAVEPITTNDTINSLAAFLEFGDGEFVGPSELDKLTMQMRSKLAAVKWLAETSMAQAPKIGHSSCVPTLFIPVRRFPLSTSLKINRRKLQKLVAPFSYAELLELANVPFSTQPYFTGIQSKPLPLTQTEESMRLIWAAVLQVMAADIKASDNFLDAGGDKLQAMRLVLSCRQNGFDIAINKLLGGTTLTQMCQSLEIKEHQLIKPMKAKVSPKPSVAVRKLPEGTDHGFVKLIVAPQLDIPWNDVIDVAEASSHQLHCLEPSLYGPRSDVRCLVINFNGAIRAQCVEEACDALTRLHTSLRTAFAVHDCNLFQVAIDSFQAEFEQKTVPVLALEKEMQQVLKRFQKEALQLRKPATKFALLDAGQQGAKLVIRFSYAQVSESAVPRLVQDFVKLYEHPTTELRRTSFFDYTRALRGARYDDSMYYWRRRLEKSKVSQVVPRSKPLPPVSEVKSIQEQVKISPLNEFGITFDSVLKAAWAMVMATLSGNPDVVFGEIVEGRRLKLETSVDVSSIAGPMENIVPIRVRFPIVNSSPLQVLQLIQRDSATSLPYEAMGAQKIVQECTDWANWSRFSTVVRHRSQVPVDGTTTLNIDNTTFTYNLLQPQIRDVPDLFVSSTMLSPDKVSLNIEFSPDRVPEQFAQAAMGLLVASVETLACYDTISQPILQPSSDYESLQPRVLLERPEPDVNQVSYSHWLTTEQRDLLQQFLMSSWNELLHPATQGISERDLIQSRFYDISGSLLPAYLFAQRLNQDLRKVEIEGIHTVHITAVEVITAPTISSQIDLITRKMQASGFLSKPGRKKPVVSFHAGFTPTKTSSSNWALLNKGKGHLRRFRHGGSHGSVKDFSSKAGGWVKSRVNLSKERSPIIAEGAISESSSWEAINHDSLGIKDGSGMQTVPEAAVEIGTSAVVPDQRHNNGDVSPLSGESPRASWKEEFRNASRSISPRSWMGH